MITTQKDPQNAGKWSYKVFKGWDLVEEKGGFNSPIEAEKAAYPTNRAVTFGNKNAAQWTGKDWDEIESLLMELGA